MLLFSLVSFLPLTVIVRALVPVFPSVHQLVCRILQHPFRLRSRATANSAARALHRLCNGSRVELNSLCRSVFVPFRMPEPERFPTVADFNSCLQIAQCLKPSVSQRLEIFRILILWF